MDRKVINAYAKINLALDVVRRRENGYHDLRMIMQTVDLCDVLTIEKIPEGIELDGNVPGLSYDSTNLIWKAAALVKETFALKEGVKIYLEKNIPMAAGMAGGSTDAAAVFNGMNELFGLNASKEKLCELGVKIGADVPYCIMGGTYLAEGIGEVLTKLPPVVHCPLLIVKPDFDVSTKYVYENINANELKSHPDVDGMIKAIENKSLEGICSLMENVMETVTEVKYPRIAELKRIMEECGAMKAMMSGSGPTVFGLFPDDESVAKAEAYIRAQGMEKQIFRASFTDSIM